jgi:hypothetical protein
MMGERIDIEAQTCLDVLLREIVLVNQRLANLIGPTSA